MKSKKVGILTLPPETNYGGILQAVCLFEFIHTLGFEPWLLVRKTRQRALQRLALALLHRAPTSLLNRLAAQANDSSVRTISGRLATLAKLVLISKQATWHHKFIERHLPNRTKNLESSSDLAQWTASNDVDALIVGSDQVWRLDYLPVGSVYDYFFGFTHAPSIRKIAYAASFGHGKWLFPEHSAALSKLLARFNAVSVREDSGQRICKEALHRPDAVHVADPTLLMEQRFFDRLIDGAKPPQQPPILRYVLDPHTAGRLTYSDLIAHLWPEAPTQTIELNHREEPERLDGWLIAFKSARFVITDSFHGMVFSIIFERPFIAIVNEQRGGDRFFSLAAKLGVTDRLTRHDARVDEVLAIARKPLDYERVRPRLEEWRRASAAFLEQALTPSPAEGSTQEQTAHSFGGSTGAP